MESLCDDCKSSIGEAVVVVDRCGCQDFDGEARELVLAPEGSFTGKSVCEV